MTPPDKSCTPCPVCRGRGWLTGPGSLAYEQDPDHEFNDPPIGCEECERTGVVTTIRAAAIESESMDKALTIIGQVLPDLGKAAAEQADREMRERGIEL